MRRLSAQAFETGSELRCWSADKNACIGEAEGAAAEQQADGYRQGYLEGFADGDADARQALSAAQEEARAAIAAAQVEMERWREQILVLTNQFAAARATLDKEMEALAVAIAYESVSRIVGAMHAERSLVPAICGTVLSELRVRPMQVRVSEMDKPAIDEAGLDIPVIADSVLRTGECVIETGTGEIETGIEHRLQILSRTLLDTLRGGESQT